MKNLFTDHPHSINETYLQHFWHAFKFGTQMIIGGFSCIMHAIFPFMCKQTASDYLLKMANDFICRMPVVDERVMKLTEAINSKVAEQKNPYST